MKARYCQALSALALGAAASFPLTASAQSRTADPNAPRLMVGVFRSADKNAGVQAADAIRNRISQDVPVKQLWVIPKQDLTNTLEASGFPTTEALAPHDARALAQLLRADEYIVGNIVRDSAGLRVDANLVLTRDNSLIQPLGSYRVDKADKAAGAISKDFRDAQKAFQYERSCVNLAREGKHDQALEAARKGLAEYSKSTWSRICMANVLREKKAAPDSILKVANEVLATDPRSIPALRIVYDAYSTAGQKDKATDVLVQLVGADPSNARLLEQVVNELAANGQAAKAVPFVNQLVTDNPGDPNYLDLQWKVRNAAKDYKGALAAADELIKTDTSKATAELFGRLTAIAIVDSQPQKAAQLAAQGVQKFPDNADLLGAYADALRASGQAQQAVEVLNKALAANPKMPGGYSNLARLYSDMGQTAQAMDALQKAVAAGDSASDVARYALVIGQTQYRKANTSKNLADFQAANSVLEFAVKTSSSPEGQFLLGANALGMGQQLLTQSQTQGKAKDTAGACQSAKGAQAAFLTAQSNLPAGGKFNPQATQQLLSALTQLSPYADQLAKAFCK